MLCRIGEAPRELNRLDIKNRNPLRRPRTRKRCWKRWTDAWARLDALVVLDQVSEADCGVDNGPRPAAAGRAGRRNGPAG